MLELASVTTHQPCVDADDVFVVLNVQRTCRVVVVCCSQDTSNVLSDQSLSTDNVPLIVDKCIDFIATYGNSVQMLVMQSCAIRSNPCVVIMLIGICKFTTPLPSNRHHQRCGDCLEGKGENYQVCSVQYCVQQLCTVRCTHI